jgi:hypothetical protein
MQVRQSRTRLGALIFDEPVACLPEQAQSFAYPPASIQGGHLAADEGLVHRIIGQQAGDLANQADVPSEVKLEFDSFDGGRPAFFLQAAAHRREPLAADSGHGLTMPEPVSLPQ